MNILVLFLTYFFTRFIDLTTLPIFNDESIYLHWGKIMISTPGQHFYSLFDGKPPLYLWNLGFIQQLPIDPLITGRLVTIIFGFITLLGILEVGKLLKFSQRVQLLSLLLYIFTPLTLFYDRLALMDSPISTIFIWVIYLSLRISQSTVNNKQLIILLGITQGIGLWIKGTAQIFLVLPFIIPILTLIIDSNKKSAGKQIIAFLSTLTIAQLLFLPIRLNPLYANYSARESDFLLPINTMLSPANWLPHTQSVLTSFIFLLTPIVLIFAIYGFCRFYRLDKKSALIILTFFGVPLIFEILTAKYFLSRYYLFTVIPIIIFCGYGLGQIKRYFVFFLIFTVLVPISLSMSLTFSPLTTLKTLSQNNILAKDLDQYYTGWSSGYGVGETVKYLENESQKSPIIVVTRADSGNPEDAIFVYLNKNKNVLLLNASRKPSAEELKPLEKYPIFFVSRGEQYLDMKNQLQEQVIYRKPYGNEFIGIYKVASSPLPDN